MTNLKRCAALAATAMLLAAGLGAAPVIEVKRAEGAEQFDIVIDGKPFTSYCFSQDKFPEKPIFYPILTPHGTQINRNYPMVKGVKGEATDHPHQQSLFFTYGAVNGIDFWNFQVNPKRRIRPVSAEAKGSQLLLKHEWINAEGVVLLEEGRVVTFGAGEGVRWMDHDITLTAMDKVDIGDSKEGSFGIRLAGSLQENLNRDIPGYLNAEGGEKMKGVWGRTSPWCAIRGGVKPAEDAPEEPVTVAIFSHPSTVNHPPYWHARDYGLFAVNPFGRKSYDKGAEERHLMLEKGQVVKARFIVAIYEGVVDKARLEKDYAEFSK